MMARYIPMKRYRLQWLLRHVQLVHDYGLAPHDDAQSLQLLWSSYRMGLMRYNNNGPDHLM